MDERTFYAAIGRTNFPERYYDLCSRFPVRDAPLYPLKSGEVKELLSALGQVARRDRRDNSYSSEHPIGRAMCHVGFVIQRSAMVEFWFWLEEGDRRIGSNFAVLAHQAVQTRSEPPARTVYPRPEFHSEDELRVILAECFNLANELVAILKQGVRRT